MVAIGAVLVVVSLSVLATRVGSLAFEATGLSADAARFQVPSMFTGGGYTTAEAESVTGDPARRRVASRSGRSRTTVGEPPDHPISIEEAP